jgi:hypothetical protein
MPSLLTQPSEICFCLGLSEDERARLTVAVRIIELARRGEHDADRLRDVLLTETNGDRPGSGRDDGSRAGANHRA